MSIRELERPGNAPVAEPPRAPADQEAERRERAHLRAPLVGASAFLASAAAGWTAAGLFTGVFARIAIFVAAAAGAAVVAVSSRTKRAVLWQTAGGGAIAALALLFFYAGGSARGGLGASIGDAIRGGGPSGSAMPFDPGWRLLLTILIGTLAAGACAISLSTGRPKLALVVSVPVLIAASLVQPRGATLRSGIPSMAMLLAALVIAFGIDLVEQGAAELRFEARRLFQGAIAIVVIAAALVGVAQAHFLFPVPDQEHVIPPRLPPDVPPLPDRQLFTVRSASQGPWRLGVLDTYDGTAWRLPSFDPARLQRVHGSIPGRAADGTVTTTFPADTLGGPVLPSLAGMATLDTSLAVSFDPQTQMLRLSGQTLPRGAVYTIGSAAPPTGSQLERAPAPPSALGEFMSVPAAPPKVAGILAEAPRAPLWDRLQYVRTVFYRSVVASGAGKPVAVPPARVDAILNGKTASPYEISAAEAMLARWAGVPARIGYGFYGGDRSGNVLSIHPRHAATWLEVYFEGYGWVPVVGVPPRARASLDQQRNQTNPLIRPTDQLALVLYVPYRQRTIQAFYVTVRFYAGVALPIVLAIALGFFFFPGALKLARRARRARWARRRGARARIAVAYAALRDEASDLNIGDPSLTPFGFLNAIAPDDELRQLTWLVSRALWGDLTRDPRDDDAEIATRLARSITRRMRRAQLGTSRMLAIGSRVSLRDPYTREIPNLWPARRSMVRRAFALGTAVVVLGAAGSWGCARGSTAIIATPATLPARLVPAAAGNDILQREPGVESRLSEAGTEALIDTVRVFTLRAAHVVDGYIEIGAFKPRISGSRPEVRRGVINGIGSANLRLTRAGSLRVYTAQTNTQSYVLWFAPEGSYFELLVARRAFPHPLDALAQVLTYQGRTVNLGGGTSALVLPDPRRGQTP
ncbi:MAG: transglutaminaseTgpA domain-containing protein [Actinomycetota bacterium]